MFEDLKIKHIWNKPLLKTFSDDERQDTCWWIMRHCLKPIPHHSWWLNHTRKLKVHHFPSNVLMRISSSHSCDMLWIQAEEAAGQPLQLCSPGHWLCPWLCSSLELEKRAGCVSLQEPNSPAPIYTAASPQHSEYLLFFSEQFAPAPAGVLPWCFSTCLAWKSHLISSHPTQSCHEEVRDNRVGKVLLLWETHPGACTGVLEIMGEFLRWNQHTDSGLCQSEGASLTTGLCESKGILCVPIGTAVACIIN